MDPARCAVGVEAVAREEASSLLGRMNVSATWRVGVTGETARPDEVRVILLDRAAANRSGQPILGATPPSFDSAPFLWIHVPNVRAALGLRPDVPLSAVDLGSVRSLGVAVGRVIAHELVHALAPSEPHGRGLMSAKLTGHQLALPRLSVDLAVGVAVRAGLRGEPSVSEPSRAP
jgi:hypothetical protein